jgi:hypothetical protein
MTIIYDYFLNILSYKESDDLFNKKEDKSMSKFPNDNNPNFNLFDPNVDNKLIQDQIANSKNLSLINIANSTAISNQIYAPNNAYSHKQQNHQLFANTSSSTTNNNNLLKTSNLAASSSNGSESISNLSLAFQNYRSTKTSNSRTYYFGSGEAYFIFF